MQINSYALWHLVSCVSLLKCVLCSRNETNAVPSEKKQPRDKTNRFICSSDIRNIKRITGHSILIMSNMLTVQQTQQTHRHRYTQWELKKRLQPAGIREFRGFSKNKSSSRYLDWFIVLINRAQNHNFWSLFASAL